MSSRIPPTTPIPAIPGATIGDFWSWAYSDLLSNTVRPLYAEWLVGAALDCLSETRIEWDAVDLVYKGKKVEVKSAGYVQSWAQKAPSKIVFDVAKKQGWDSTTNTSLVEAVRSADVYVFALHVELDRARASVQDLDQWRFYVVPTSAINQALGDQKSVVLARIEAMAKPVPFSGLKAAVDQGLTEEPPSVLPKVRQLRFASWNLNGRRITSDHIAFLANIDLDIVAFQEVTAAGFSDFQATGFFSWLEHSLNLHAPEVDAPKARRIGCMVAGTKRSRLIRPSVLTTAPFPERTLLAEVGVDGTSVHVGSFHIPPGSVWGDLKSQSFQAICRWIEGTSGHVLVGIDANAPAIDHPDHSRNAWWMDGEESLLGYNANHRLTDSFRAYLANNPAVFAGIKADRPDGPLAVSYLQGRGQPQDRTPSRYDFVLASPTFRVDQVEYIYDEAVAAGSDHAIVVADLALVEMG